MRSPLTKSKFRTRLQVLRHNQVSLLFQSQDRHCTVDYQGPLTDAIVEQSLNCIARTLHVFYIIIISCQSWTCFNMCPTGYQDMRLFYKLFQCLIYIHYTYFGSTAYLQLFKPISHIYLFFRYSTSVLLQSQMTLLS